MATHQVLSLVAAALCLGSGALFLAGGMTEHLLDDEEEDMVILDAAEEKRKNAGRKNGSDRYYAKRLGVSCTGGSLGRVSIQTRQRGLAQKGHRNSHLEVHSRPLLILDARTPRNSRSMFGDEKSLSCESDGQQSFVEVSSCGTDDGLWSSLLGRGQGKAKTFHSQIFSSTHSAESLLLGSPGCESLDNHSNLGRVVSKRR